MKKKIYNAINKVMRHTRWYDRYWGGVTKFWYLRTFNLDIVNLGSNSGKYAFNYDGLNIQGRNWAVGPQSLLHDFNILKNYFSYLKKGAIVVIPLCPFSSLLSPYSKESNLKYYTFLHPATILEFNEKERIRALRIKDNPFNEMPYYCIKQSFKELINYMRLGVHSRCNYELNSTWFIDLWKRQFGIEDLDAPLSTRHQLDQENRQKVLEEMIDFCIERGFRPHLVIPPIHPALARKFTPRFKENYIYSFIRKANKAQIPFWDYMDSVEFEEDKYFSNSFLLNKKGAKYFTRVFINKIKGE